MSLELILCDLWFGDWLATLVLEIVVDMLLHNV